MRFFNIRFKNKSKAGAIGIIGGASGPTAIYVSKDKEKKEQEQEKFLLYAAEQLTPCKRTFNELEEYLIEKYHAVPHTLLPHELKILKANVIMNHFDYVLDKPEPLGQNPTKKEIRRYFEKDTSFLQAKEYPSEKLGLELKAYKLTNFPSRLRKERELKNKEQYENTNSCYTGNDVIVEMEMKSQYLSIVNGDDEIIYDLLLYSGISEQDIKEKNPRFIAYAYALKHIGKL